MSGDSSSRKDSSGGASEPVHDEHTFSGVVRTDLYCNECSKNFIAALDFDKNGNHEIICPRCGHVHYRHIKDGKVTDDRYKSGSTFVKVPSDSTWKAPGMTTQPRCHFLRDRWLNREQ